MNVLFGDLNDSGLEDGIGAETLRTGGGGGRVGGRRRRWSEARGASRHPREKVEFVALLRVEGGWEEGFCERERGEEEERRGDGMVVWVWQKIELNFLPSSLSLARSLSSRLFQSFFDATSSGKELWSSIYILPLLTQTRAVVHIIADVRPFFFRAKINVRSFTSLSFVPNCFSLSSGEHESESESESFISAVRGDSSMLD